MRNFEHLPEEESGEIVNSLEAVETGKAIEQRDNKEKQEQYNCPDFVFDVGELAVSNAREKDNNSIEDFVRKAGDSLLRRSLSGEQINVAGGTIDSHENEFVPNKLGQIENDARIWVEGLAENLRKSGNDKNKSEREEIARKVENDPNFIRIIFLLTRVF